MKHWHRCRRWWDKELACPFGGLEDHNDDEPPEPDAHELISFERTPATAWGPVRPSVPARRTVAVRQPRAAPVPAAVETRALPQPAPTGLLEDLVGVPFPPPEGLKDVTESIRDGIGQVPARWAPTQEQLATLFARMGITLPITRADTITGVAEAAVADKIGNMVAEGREFAAGRGLNFLDAVPAAAIPLLKLLGKRRPGAPRRVMGQPGRMDPARPPSTFRTGQGRHRTAPAFHPLTGGPRPPGRRGGFGGMHVNMSDWIKRLTVTNPRQMISGPAQNIAGRQSRGGL